MKLYRKGGLGAAVFQKRLRLLRQICSVGYGQGSSIMVVKIGQDAGWRRPLCISIDAALLARRLNRRRQALRRKVFSLAAVHEPPDKIEIDIDSDLAAINCAKRSTNLAGFHRRRHRSRNV